jgi:hypothetical protein
MNPSFVSRTVRILIYLLYNVVYSRAAKQHEASSRPSTNLLLPFTNLNINTRILQSCHATCQTCLDGNSSPSGCTKCKSYMVPLTTLPGVCVCSEKAFQASDLSCKLCLPTCKKCSGPTTCSSCEDGAVLDPVTGLCKCTQAEGFYMVPYIGTCKPCHPKCSTCSGDSEGQCLSCKSGAYLEIGGPPYCKCTNTNTFLNSLGVCEQCHQSCAQCTGPLETDCTWCPVQSTLNSLLGKCSCNEFYYLDVSSSPTKCSACFETCKTCKGPNSNDCMTCKPTFIKLSSGECVCEIGYKYASPQFTCDKILSCDTTCGSCSGISKNQCLTCKSQAILSEQGTCLCDAGYFPQSDGTCPPCDGNCKTCMYDPDNINSKCTSCKTGSPPSNNLQYYPSKLSITDSFCTCEIGWFSDPNNNYVCMPCSQGLRGCKSTSSTVATCPSGSLYQNGQCVCPSRYYLSTSLSTCVLRSGLQCSSQNSLCMACDSASSPCAECPSNSYLGINGQCECATGYGYDGEKNYCAPCHITCSECTMLYSNKCTKCLTAGLAVNSQFQCTKDTTIERVYLDNLSGEYKNCHPSCAGCTNSTETGCTSCRTDFTRMPDGSCRIIDSKYMLLGVVYSCDLSCKSCKGATANNCTSCNSNAFLKDDGSCDCIRKFYKDSMGHCIACDPKCATCTGPSNTSCTSCPKPYNLTAGACTCNLPLKLINSKCNYQFESCYDSNLLRATPFSCTSTLSPFGERTNPQSVIYYSCDSNSYTSAGTCISCKGVCENGCFGANPQSSCLPFASTASVISGIYEMVCTLSNQFLTINQPTEESITCSVCNTNCKRCRGSASNCTECNNGYYLDINNSQGTCKKNGVPMPSPACTAPCLTCEAGNPSACITCVNSESYILNSMTKTCICAENYTMNSNGTCLQNSCNSPCKNCYYQTPDICIECFEGANQILNITKCLCTESTYKQDNYGICRGLAVTNCSQCTGQPNQCNPGYYFSSQNLDCLPCHSTCLTCSGPDYFHCTSCIPALVLKFFGGICGCTSGNFLSPATNTCQPCHQSCLECKEMATMCTECKDPAILHGRNCYCPDMLFPDRTLGCVANPVQPILCAATCKTCHPSSPTSCIECEDNTYYELGTCKPIKLQYLDSQLQLKPCGQNCLYCTDATTCTQCILPSFSPVGGVCPCPSYWTADLPNIGCPTRTCHLSCAACDENGCKFCKYPHATITASSQACICPPSFYLDPSDGSCRECHPSCLECSSYLSSNCISCKQSSITPVDGQCICPSGTYMKEDGYCNQCHLSCLTCNGGTGRHCTSCKQNAQLTSTNFADGQYCICNLGYRYNSLGGVCVLVFCHYSCQTCSSALPNACSSCKDIIAAVQPDGTCKCPSKKFMDGTGMCISCHASCVECSGPKDNECMTCQQNSFLTAVGKCEPDSGFHYAALKYNSYSVSPLTCSPSCLTCSDTTSNSCLTCKLGALLSRERECVCKEGFWMNPNNLYNCDPCHSTCKLCSGPGVTQCTQCHLAMNMYLDSTSACICSFGYTMINNVCVKAPSPTCHTSCLTCFNSLPTGCLTCPPSSTLLASENRCACDSNQYQTQSGSCAPCPPLCDRCTGPLNTDCTRCSYRAVVSTSGSCACSVGYYYYQSVSYSGCNLCHPTCVTCTGGTPNSCTACPEGSSLSSTNECLPGPGLAFSGSNVFNLECDLKCKSCGSQRNLCTQCWMNAALQPNQDCLCIPGYKQNTNTGKCEVVSCHPTCKTCVTALSDGCTSCHSNADLVSTPIGSCKCTRGFGFAPDFICRPCYPTCLTCTYSFI